MFQIRKQAPVLKMMKKHQNEPQLVETKASRKQKNVLRIKNWRLRVKLRKIEDDNLDKENSKPKGLPKFQFESRFAEYRAI